MKYIIVLTMLLFNHYLYAKCLVKQEVKFIKNEINNKDFYSDVPNFIQCKNKNSALNKFVCNNNEYLLMFNYLSKVNVYKHEDILKREVNHDIFNKKNMNHWHKRFDKDNSTNLCFDIKVATMAMTGGNKPYITAYIEDKTYIFQENKYGGVLRNRENYKIYMGKSCDIQDSKKNTGNWYYDDSSGKYILKFKNKSLSLFLDNSSLDNYNCKEEIKPISKIKEIKEEKSFFTKLLEFFNLTQLNKSNLVMKS